MLHRHPGVLASNQPSPYSRDPRRNPCFRKRLAEASWPFSIFRKRSPLFAPHRSMRRPETLALASGGAARRVWLPFRRIQLSRPQELLSAPNAPELFPSERFSSRMIEDRFPYLSRSCAFLPDPRGASQRRFSGFIPSGKPSPFSQPGFLRRVGGMCSLGLHHLSGAPFEDPRQRASPSPAIPSHPSEPEDLTISRTASLRVSLSSTRRFPPKRAPTRWMFPADCRIPALEEVHSPWTIFSS